MEVVALTRAAAGMAAPPEVVPSVEVAVAGPGPECPLSYDASPPDSASLRRAFNAPYGVPTTLAPPQLTPPGTTTSMPWSSLARG
jgi:hypothetical protein